MGRHGADDYDSIASKKVLKDGGGAQVSVHSSHRYHSKFLSDVVQALSSVDRGLIPNRVEINPEDESGNHYRLT